MIWVKDMWFFFMKNCSENAYVNILSHELVLVPEEGAVPIPKVFTPADLIREYAKTFGDRRLTEQLSRMSDDEVCGRFRGHVTDDMLFYMKDIAVKYAAQWLSERGIRYSVKEDNPYGGTAFIDII